MDQAHPPSSQDSPRMNSTTTSLEAVELEFALGAQDVLADGFECSLSKAAKIVGGEVLFNMPALDTTTTQRVGAILLPADHNRSEAPQGQVVFVTLLNDGITLSHAPLSGNNVLLESLGHNYALVMSKLK